MSIGKDAPVLRDAVTDGIVTLRPPRPGDAALLKAGRDDEFHRWLGSGSDDPQPTACIVVDDEVVGWIDYDREGPWLADDAVNIGYSLSPAARGNGYATRALALLLRELAATSDHETATVLIDPHNTRSLAVAHRAGFVECGEVDGQVLLSRSIRT
ncbi:MAG TPA: GNAT family N-acetyltransferase [Acidimicrobiales bacterium]|nr:GNAT family N-acetyltransferase [Acidimicrobiales bacterium]